MKLGDVVGFALGNLRRRPLRTALTVSGVAVGVGTLVLLVSLASGLQHMFSSQFDNADLVTRVVVERQGRGRGLRALLDGRDEPEGPPLTDAAIQEMRALPGVVAAFPEVVPFLGMEANQRIAQGFASGLPIDALDPSALQVGRYWEVPDAGHVCVLPSALLRRLGYADANAALGTKLAVTHAQALIRYSKQEVPGGAPDAEPTYRYVRPGNVEVLELDVIGVYDSDRLGLLGRLVHVPMETALLLQKRFGWNTGLPEGEHLRAVVRVRGHDDVEPVAQAIRAMPYRTETVFDYLQAIQILFSVVKALLAVFGGVGLVVAFFGIANTMLMAVLERTREVGVLKALGARDRDVSRIFVVEAAAIGALGGLVGLAGAWGLGQVANLIARAAIKAPQVEQGFFLVERWVGGAAVLLAIVVAGVAGLYPAWRASRLAPVEALRRE